MPPAPPALTLSPLQTIAEELAECQSQLKAWTEMRESLLHRMELLYTQGMAPEKFKHNGLSFARSQGRTYDYSSCPEIIQAQERLKDLQERAKAAGAATIKPSKATWRIAGGRGEA